MSRHRVAGLDELAEAGRKVVTVRGLEIGVFWLDGEVRAWRNVCPHAAAPVCLGTISGTALPSGVYEYSYGLERRVLRCPWHGWEFDLLTGASLADPGVRLKGYDVEIEGGDVFVVLPNRAARPGHASGTR